ncbi:hypothetical protein PoB_004467000 [Plakobranchus ocellatus]|uniref:Uncharacterized protein n=1 Tax=Plakobranchus ocellatus TaxID=259542 RepID=A0AAV4BGD7_9GAST|nr:hypothetical protein PoB_004467000 [Plakobranchus ocellatus]
MPKGWRWYHDAQRQEVIPRCPEAGNDNSIGRARKRWRDAQRQEMIPRCPEAGNDNSIGRARKRWRDAQRKVMAARYPETGSDDAVRQQISSVIFIVLQSSCSSVCASLH